MSTADSISAYGGQSRTLSLSINDLEEEKRVRAVNTLKEGIDEAWELV